MTDYYSQVFKITRTGVNTMMKECGCDCECSCGGSCECHRQEGHFERRYQTKAEKISELEAYLA